MDLGFDLDDCLFETKENEEFMQRVEPLSAPCKSKRFFDTFYQRLEVLTPFPSSSQALQAALPSLLSELHLNAQLRLEIEASHHARERSHLLRPLYDEMLASRRSALEKALFPAFVVVLALPSVKGFWYPEPISGMVENSGVNQKSWDTARPSMLKEIKAFADSDTLLHLLSLARAVQVQPNAEELFSLFPALTLPIASNWTPHPLLGSLLPSRSPLPSVAEAYRALSAPFARWLCIAPGCQASLGYKDLRVHQYEKHGGGTTEGLISSRWMEVLLLALGETGAEDEDGLQGLGEVFKCGGDNCAGEEEHEKQGTRRMEWTELVSPFPSFKFAARRVESRIFACIAG